MSDARIQYALGAQRERLVPPEPGRRIIVNVALNVEHWPLDRPMPRKIISSPHGREHVPDVPNFSWVEQGMRLGLPRIVELMSRLGVKASVNMNASVVDAYPAAADLLLQSGYELVGHGFDQQALPDAADERAVIRESLSKLAAFSGQRVRGWLGPGLHETPQTLDLLSEAGVDYVCDWVLDEVPVWVRASPRPLVAVPYSLELNDSVIYAVEHRASGELLRRVIDTLRSYDSEEAAEPMVLALPIHPHLIGARHRFPYFAEVLSLLVEREDTLFLTGSQICDWYTSQSPSRTD